LWLYRHVLSYQHRSAAALILGRAATPRGADARAGEVGDEVGNLRCFDIMFLQQEDINVPAFHFAHK
jgi:hypothetical protein